MNSENPQPEVTIFVMDPYGRCDFTVLVDGMVLGIYPTLSEAEAAVKAHLGLGADGQIFRSRGLEIDEIIAQALAIAARSNKGEINNLKRRLGRRTSDIETIYDLCASLILLCKAYRVSATWDLAAVARALAKVDESVGQTFAKQSMNLAPADVPKEISSRAKTSFAAGENAAKTNFAAQGGRAKYKNNPDAKAFVQREWCDHRDAYGGNKSEFARVYVRRVLNEYGVKVTEKTIREVWLHTLNEGTPAR